MQAAGQPQSPSYRLRHSQVIHSCRCVRTEKAGLLKGQRGPTADRDVIGMTRQAVWRPGQEHVGAQLLHDDHNPSHGLCLSYMHQGPIPAIQQDGWLDTQGCTGTV
jgi:hypothetical protein